MANSEQRLGKLLTEIEMLYVQSKEDNLQKKLEHYQDGIILINEAKKLIDEMENEITNLDMSKADKSQVANARKLISMIELPNLNHKELVSIIRDLKQIAKGQPTTVEVTDNMENEVIIYEEQNI